MVYANPIHNRKISALKKRRQQVNAKPIKNRQLGTINIKYCTLSEFTAIFLNS
jgi:hypothetical protein